MQESHKRVQWVYEATNDKELEGRYDQWAADGYHYSALA